MATVINGLPIQPVAPARPELVTDAAADGWRIGLAVRYDPTIAPRLKGLDATWLPPRRMWIFPVSSFKAALARLPATFPDHRTERVREVCAAAWRRRQPQTFAPSLDVQVFPALTAGRCYLRSAFDRVLVSAMHACAAEWRAGAEVWEVPLAVATLLEHLAVTAGIAAEFVYCHGEPIALEALVDGPPPAVSIAVPQADLPEGGGGAAEKTWLAPSTALADAVAIDAQILAAASERFGLTGRYAFQRAGVEHLLGRTSALLADDMGLGKSRQACVAAHLAAGDGRILVVCPASLRINWQREIGAVDPGAHIVILGERPVGDAEQARWVVASYEQLGGLVHRPELAFAVMVVDEAHYLKEHNAGRTRHAFLLAQRIPRRFLLTGTPLLNRETELHTLLRLSGHPLGQLELTDFRATYCGEAEARQTLKQQLDGWMLRRSKGVLPELPAKSRQTILLDLGDRRDEYAALLNRLELPSLARITALRQLLETVKLPWLLDTLYGLGEDDKILVFCEFRATVERLLDALRQDGSPLGAVSLVGDDPLRRRQAAVDRFQSDPDTRVFVATTAAAGVGLTLTAANLVTFVSLPWTPAAQRQAEDRAYRNGQTRPVTVLIPLVDGTIDQDIATLLTAKATLEQELITAAPAPADPATLAETILQHTQGRACAPQPA